MKGDFDVAMAMVKALSKESSIYVVNSLNSFRLEGQKTMMFEFLIIFVGKFLTGLYFREEILVTLQLLVRRSWSFTNMVG